MKKTLTMSLALAGIAGLALAEVTIETAPAGYIEKAGSAAALLVSNPFGSLTGAVPTLGDLDGSSLTANDYVKIISEKGKTLFTAKYSASATPAGWYDGESCSNAFPLARGTSIQFYSPNGGGTLVIAGLVQNGGEALTLVTGHNFIGNVSAKRIYLRDISVSAFAPLGGEYAMVNNTKVVWVPSAVARRVGLCQGWYLYSDINGSHPENATDIMGSEAAGTGWFINAGEGFRVYVKKSAGATITLPGLN